MMGQKVFQEKFFYNFSLSQRVPEDHILRKLCEVVDLSFVRGLTAPYYSYTGHPSVDPVVLFKMMLLGYLYGITSERRLAEECSLNLAFMWYLGYDVDEPTPDHSVISKARARYGKEAFEKFFERILELCVKAGLVTGEKVFADSTLIRANASLKSVVPRSDAFQPSRSPKEHIEQVFTENPVSSEEDPEPVLAQVTAQSAKMGAAGDQAAFFDLPEEEQGESDGKATAVPIPVRRGRPAKPKQGYNEQYVSKTDPDASVVSRPIIGKGLFYKEHFTVDSSRVITAVRVTPAAVEDYTQVRELLDKHPIVPKRFCADSHYGVPEVYGELKRREILPTIPRRSSHTQKPRPGHLPVSAFRYDPERDVYLCPQNKPLRRAAFEAKWQRYHYRPRHSDCQGCPFRKACATEKSVRTVIRAKEEEALTWAMEQLQTPQAVGIMTERSVCAEGVAGEAKGFHGLRRALCRGLEKVTIQALLIAAVQNLKRLVKAKVHSMEEKIGAACECLTSCSFLVVFRKSWATAPTSV